MGKLRKFRTIVLTVVGFVSGLIVTFQWMGHDDGRSVFNMLKRPDVIEREVKIVVYEPLIISDNYDIMAMNKKYRETLIRVEVYLAQSKTGVSDQNKIKAEVVKALKYTVKSKNSSL